MPMIHPTVTAGEAYFASLQERQTARMWLQDALEAEADSLPAEEVDFFLGKAAEAEDFSRAFWAHAQQKDREDARKEREAARGCPDCGSDSYGGARCDECF